MFSLTTLSAGAAPAAPAALLRESKDAWRAIKNQNFGLVSSVCWPDTFAHHANTAASDTSPSFAYLSSLPVAGLPYRASKLERLRRRKRRRPRFGEAKLRHREGLNIRRRSRLAGRRRAIWSSCFARGPRVIPATFVGQKQETSRAKQTSHPAGYSNGDTEFPVGSSRGKIINNSTYPTTNNLLLLLLLPLNSAAANSILAASSLFVFLGLSSSQLAEPIVFCLLP